MVILVLSLLPSSWSNDTRSFALDDWLQQIHHFPGAGALTSGPIRHLFDSIQELMLVIVLSFHP